MTVALLSIGTEITRGEIVNTTASWLAAELIASGYNVAAMVAVPDQIDMVANTGTYLDSPFHRYADGKDLADLRLESLADLDSVVVEARDRPGRAIDEGASSRFAGPL